MEQRDLLKQQIEQLGRALAKVLADFIGLKTAGKVSQGIAISNRQLKEKTNVDFLHLLTLSKKEMKAYLEGRKLAAEHLEILAQYAKEIGLTQTHNAKNTFKKALMLMELADEDSNAFSFDRDSQKKEIKSLLLNFGPDII